MNSTILSAEDTEAIRQLLARCNHAIDHGRTGQWVDCFADDGVYQCLGLPPDAALGGQHQGPNALMAYADTHFKVHKGRARNHSSSVIIEGLADGRASVASYLNVYESGQQGAAGLLATAICQDEMAKDVDGRWRITKRVLTIDPAPE